MFGAFNASVPLVSTTLPLLPIAVLLEKATSPSKVAVWLFRLKPSPGEPPVWLKRMAAPGAALTVIGLMR